MGASPAGHRPGRTALLGPQVRFRKSPIKWGAGVMRVTAVVESSEPMHEAPPQSASWPALPVQGRRPKTDNSLQRCRCEWRLIRGVAEVGVLRKILRSALVMTLGLSSVPAAATATANATDVW